MINSPQNFKTQKKFTLYVVALKVSNNYNNTTIKILVYYLNTLLKY